MCDGEQNHDLSVLLKDSRIPHSSIHMHCHPAHQKATKVPINTSYGTFFILNVEPGNWSHHQVVLNSESPLARQRSHDFAPHDTSPYRINLSNCREIHYISSYFIHLINLCICIHIQVHTYIHTCIHNFCLVLKVGVGYMR